MSCPGLPCTIIQVLKQELILFLEPIGSKSPSFSSGSKSAWFEIEQGDDFALLCLAQGYPVPIYR